MLPDRAEDKPDRPITGWEIFRLPEFQALCGRLGIAWRLPTRRLVIDIPAYPEDVVKVTHEYLTGGMKYIPAGVNRGEPLGSVNTTSSNNERFQTSTLAAGPTPVERERKPPFDNMEETVSSYVPSEVPVDTTITEDTVPLEIQRRWENKVQQHFLRERQDPGRLIAPPSNEPHPKGCYCYSCEGDGDHDSDGGPYVGIPKPATADKAGA